jgi:hypothetical protein
MDIFPVKRLSRRSRPPTIPELQLDVNAQTGWPDEVHPRVVWHVNYRSDGGREHRLIHTYENLRDRSGADPSYWTAVHYRTGKVAWRQRSGYGGLFNNHHAGIALGQASGGNPTLYLGGVGGIMALRDR